MDRAHDEYLQGVILSLMPEGRLGLVLTRIPL